MASKCLVAWCVGTVVALSRVLPVHASDFEVSWSVPPDCPDREQFRGGLSRLVGREVTFGEDAAVGAAGAIETREEGYELDLLTWTPAGSERRTLQARSCSELMRAGLLITALLLSDRLSKPAAAVSGDDPLRIRVAARVRAIGDVGSISSVSFGPGVGLGLGLHRTWLEVGAMLLPPHDVRVSDRSGASASIELLTANAGICQEFFAGPTLAPCLHLELGRIGGRGRKLTTDREVSATWLSGTLGARTSVELFDAVFATADIRAGLPWSRPRFVIEGIGTVHNVPAVFGRVELSLEGRF